MMYKLLFCVLLVASSGRLNATRVIITTFENETPVTLCLMFGTKELVRVTSTSALTHRSIELPLDNQGSTSKLPRESFKTPNNLYISSAADIYRPLFMLAFVKEAVSARQVFASGFIKAVDETSQAEWTRFITFGQSENDTYELSIELSQDTNGRFVAGENSIDVDVHITTL